MNTNRPKPQYTDDSDLGKFIALYKSFGVDLSEKVTAPPQRHDNEDKDLFAVEMKEGDFKELIGYSWFYSIVFFNKEGKFVKQGFWE